MPSSTHPNLVQCMPPSLAECITTHDSSHAALRWLAAGNSVERGISNALLRAAKLPDASSLPTSDPTPSELSEMREAHRHDTFSSSPLEFIEALMSSFQHQRARLLQGVSTAPVISPHHSGGVPRGGDIGFLMTGREFFDPAVFQIMDGDTIEEEQDIDPRALSIGVLRCKTVKPISSRVATSTMGGALREVSAHFEWPDASYLQDVAQDGIDKQGSRIGRAGHQYDDAVVDEDEEEVACMRSVLPNSVWIQRGSKRARSEEGEGQHGTMDAELAPVALEVAVEGPRRGGGKASLCFEASAGVLSVYETGSQKGIPTSQHAVLKREVLVDGSVLTLDER